MLSIDTAIRFGIRQQERERINECVNELNFMGRSLELLAETNPDRLEDHFLELFLNDAGEMVSSIASDIDGITSEMNNREERGKSLARKLLKEGESC